MDEGRSSLGDVGDLRLDEPAIRRTFVSTSPKRSETSSKRCTHVRFLEKWSEPCEARTGELARRGGTEEREGAYLEGDLDIGEVLELERGPDIVDGTLLEHDLDVLGAAGLDRLEDVGSVVLALGVLDNAGLLGVLRSELGEGRRVLVPVRRPSRLGRVQAVVVPLGELEGVAVVRVRRGEGRSCESSDEDEGGHVGERATGGRRRWRAKASRAHLARYSRLDRSGEADRSDRKVTRQE